MSFAMPAPRKSVSFAAPASLRPGAGFLLPVILYLVFALADLLCSLVAFSYGISEGNPFMAWLLRNGIFVEGKIAISFVVAAVMAVVYGASPRGRVVAWGAVISLGMVVAYHAWALPQIMGHA